MIKRLAFAIFSICLFIGHANAQSACSVAPVSDDDKRAIMAIGRVFMDRYLNTAIPNGVGITYASRDCFSLRKSDNFGEGFVVRIYKIDGTDCTYLMETPTKKVARINFNKLTTRIVADRDGAIRVRGFFGAVCNGDGTLCMSDYAGAGGGNRFDVTARSLLYIFSNVCTPAALTPEQEFN